MNLVSLQKTQTMSSRAIAELLNARHDVVKRSIERLFSKTDDEGNPTPVIIEPPLVDEPFLDSMNRPRVESVYLVNKRDSYVVVAQLSPEFTGKLVDRWQELENAVAKPVIDFNDPATLRAMLIDYTENVVRLTHERDNAIITKAHISDKKTATALNTASQAVKRANKLESEIGRCINHATILAVRNATGTEYAWQPLRKYCKAFDIDTNTVHDERYGKVKSYPARAWMAVHGVDINVLFGE